MFAMLGMMFVKASAATASSILELSPDTQAMSEMTRQAQHRTFS